MIMKSKKGFTLLEVMVSISILGVIMMLVWQTNSQTIRAKKRIDTREDIYHQGTVSLQKISTDVSMAFLAKIGITSTLMPTPTPPPTQTVIQGEEIKTFLIGEDRGERDELKFTAFSHLRFFKNAKESDQCKVYYEVVTSETEGGTYNLIRHEEVWLDSSTDVKGEGLVLAENIQKFNLEYYDSRQNEWRKDWDTEKIDWRGRLPSAVKITISFQDPDDERNTIDVSTAVLLPLSRGVIEM